MPEKKYGLQLRVPPSHHKQQPARAPLPKPEAFNDDDDDDVESEIARQASKAKSVKDIEEQHKKALEEDPSVFDYDGVYDDMKGKVARPRHQDRQERKPKYIQALMEKAKVREREHEIVFERKLAKERSKDDHLYADKDKFVTSAYKRKLAEQAKWLEEERLRGLREERDDVTKKSDLSDFYFNLSKNRTFGANDVEKPKQKEQVREPEPEPVTSAKEQVRPSKSPPRGSSSRSEERHPDQGMSVGEKSQEPGSNRASQPTENEKPSAEDQPKRDHHKRSEDAVLSAKERYLARKRAKEQ